MRVDINSQLSSISAFELELRIPTPHSLFWDFGADKNFTTCQGPVGQAEEFKFEFKFKCLQVI